MALSREEYLNIIKSISERTGDSEDIMNDLRVLSDNYPEAEVISNYKEEDVFSSDGIKWSEKYDDMRRRYRERFFSGVEEAKTEQMDDIEEDNKSVKNHMMSYFQTVKAIINKNIRRNEKWQQNQQ